MSQLEAAFIQQHLWVAACQASVDGDCSLNPCVCHHGCTGWVSLGLPLSLFGTLGCAVIAGLLCRLILG